MSLIPPDEIAILKSASDVKSVADSAELEAEKMAVAKLINSSANTGQYEVLYNHEMSEELIQAIQGEGYTVTRRSKLLCAEPKYQYVISWKDSGEP